MSFRSRCVWRRRTGLFLVSLFLLYPTAIIHCTTLLIHHGRRKSSLRRRSEWRRRGPTTSHAERREIWAKKSQLLFFLGLAQQQVPVVFIISKNAKEKFLFCFQFIYMEKCILLLLFNSKAIKWTSDTPFTSCCLFFLSFLMTFEGQWMSCCWVCLL